MKSASRGFTLIELLMAVTLAAGVALLAATLMHTLIDNSARNAARLAQHLAVADLQRMLERAWASRQAAGFAANDKAVQFISSDKSVGAKPIELDCQSQGNAPKDLVLYRSLRQARDADAAAEDPGETLLSGLTRCSFGYLAPPAGGREPARWVADWEEGKPPPAVMRLDLTTAQGALPPLIVAVDSP